MSRESRQYERPGGLINPDGPRRRRTPRLLRGKPLRRIQREFYQRWYRYPHRNLLVIGQPKSGSTWLENMLLEVPGFFRWFPPSMNRQNMKQPDFHEFIETEMRHLPPGFTISKTHSFPSPNNISVLERLGRPYIVLIRDPRDLAVSWSFFVVNRPENAFYDDVKGMSVEDRLAYYIEHVLDDMLEWATGWQREIHPSLGMLLRYEDLLEHTHEWMEPVMQHFGIKLTQQRIDAMIENNRFERVTGRKAGEADPAAFQRKGISGDWVNHFTPALIQRFNEVAAQRLDALGYPVLTEVPNGPRPS